MRTVVDSPWLLQFGKKPQAKMRLFCLPFAGGAASFYRGWSDQFPAEIELIGVQYPGRENRLFEEPIGSVAGIVDEVVGAIRPFLSKPYAIYGHSMGALVSFELTRQLRRLNLSLPQQLFVSAYRSPHLPNNNDRIHQLPTPQFLNKIRDLNGTPEEVFQNRELLSLILPMLRADFQAHETHVYVEEPPLPVPIMAFAGETDTRFSLAEIEAWQQQTSTAFHFQTFAGGHFFVKPQQEAFCETLIAALRNKREPI